MEIDKRTTLKTKPKLKGYIVKYSNSSDKYEKKSNLDNIICDLTFFFLWALYA